MSKRTLTPEGIPEIIDYRGWKIWAWTGWKGQKSTICSDGASCSQCGQPLSSGSVIWATEGPYLMHWTCRYPDNRPDILQAQWFAEKNGRFLEANCAPITLTRIPAGEYKRGYSFEIVTEELAVREDTPESVREVAKQAGLKRLKMLIDEIEDAGRQL